MIHIAVVGATGFVGRPVAVSLSARGAAVRPVKAPRVRADFSDLTEQARAWRRHNPAAFTALVGAVAGCRVVVNAAGVAAPAGEETPAMVGANGLLPTLIAQAAAAAGVSRLIHVSSAAVQGRRDPLDESATVAPVTPYGASKALGEKGLLAAAGQAPPEVVVYRPTSIQDAGRGITRSFVALTALPCIPVAAGCPAPLPVTVIDNVVAGLAHVAFEGVDTPIVLQPSEGITAQLLLSLAGARLLPVPRGVLSCLLTLSRLGQSNARLTAAARRLELVWLGQRVEATTLARAGFQAPAGIRAYREVIATVQRQRSRRGPARTYDETPA